MESYKRHVFSTSNIPYPYQKLNNVNATIQPKQENLQRKLLQIIPDEERIKSAPYEKITPAFVGPRGNNQCEGAAARTQRYRSAPSQSDFNYSPHNGRNYTNYANFNPGPMSFQGKLSIIRIVKYFKL
jgi:hypothetical protein